MTLRHRSNWECPGEGKAGLEFPEKTGANIADRSVAVGHLLLPELPTRRTFFCRTNSVRATDPVSMKRRTAEERSMRPKKRERILVSDEVLAVFLLFTVQPQLDNVHLTGSFILPSCSFLPCRASYCNTSSAS